MRKLFLSTALLILLGYSTDSFAQFRLGARAGLSAASESRDNAGTLSSHVGFVGGLDAEYWFSTMFGINAQLLYDQKGVQEVHNVPNPIPSDPNNVVEVTSTTSLNYLEIPILLRANLTDGKYRPYIFAGPSIGLFMSGQVQDVPSGESVGSNLNQTTDINSSDVNSPELSLLFGAGVSYKMVYGPAFFLDAGYAMGMTNFAKSGTTMESMNIKSKDIRVMLGISLQMGDARDLW
jgi:hypothetical protein